MATETDKILRHHHHHHAPFIHDLGLMNFLIYLWLGIVLAGFMLNSGFQFLHEHSLFPSFSSSFAPSSSDGTWTHLESHGDVELQYRTIIPTSGLHAHRAVAVADLPIEALLHVFRDTPNNVKWAKDLKECSEYHKSGVRHMRGHAQTQTSTVRQRYNVPVPGFADRELLMTKKMTAVENSGGTHSLVIYDFSSLPEENNSTGFGVCTGCVRATNLGSKWTFISLGDGKKTKIEAEIAIDPQMSNLSNFFINLFQKKWPHVSLNRLMKEARHHLNRDDDVQVATTFFRLFPLKT